MPSPRRVSGTSCGPSCPRGCPTPRPGNWCRASRCLRPSVFVLLLEHPVEVRDRAVELDPPEVAPAVLAAPRLLLALEFAGVDHSFREVGDVRAVKGDVR